MSGATGLVRLTFMAVFPILIDSRPPYLKSDSSLSLLQMPLGPGTLLSHYGERLLEATRRRPSIIRDFPADERYEDSLQRSDIVRDASVSAEDFSARIAAYEPSDWLLLLDPRCFPVEWLDLAAVLEGRDDAPRFARHLIALDSGTLGTNERVEFDAEKRVRRVQRYYDAVTWTVARGVACSIVPVAAVAVGDPLPFGSLLDLRRALATWAVPSRDIPIVGSVVDLSTERGLLTINDRMLINGTPGGEQRSRHNGSTVHPLATIAGPVVLQPGCRIDQHATVIGPAVVGAGASIGRDAVVAQCVVAPNAVVACESILRHRVVTSTTASRALLGAPMLEDPDDEIQDERWSEPQRRGVYLRLKVLIESLAAIAALLVLAPVMVLVAILVKLDSRGPIFFGDPREAKGGRSFRCYKFRTMRVGAELAQRELAGANQVDGPQFKIDRDPRVTRLGRWLRATSLDELPQLFNVALGQMSLVGPRPSPFRENQTCVPWREARLSVRPGITGLWQVCRHNRQAGDFHQWIYYDIEYIRHMSFLVDMKIMAATLWTLGGKGHVPLSWIIPSASKELV